MKKKISILFLGLLLIISFAFPISVSATSEQLYLGGMPAGFSLLTRGASVVGITDVITENGVKSPSKDAGILAGDIILSIDGNEVNDAKDIAKYANDGKTKTLYIKRGKDNLLLDLTPVKDMTNRYKIGVFIRDNINGIGTVSYIKGDEFASLGHPVVDENGSVLEIVGGELFSCRITGVKKGERGFPGELHGVFVRTEKKADITRNTISGVYGKLNKSSIDYNSLTKIEKGKAKMGNATIFSTVNGDTPIEYSISIVKVDESEEVKNFVIKINDEQLIDQTGGIVQGMSGSPIVQDGKLVGAVTHVFINDPTRGFGISIDNMLKDK